MNCLVDVQSVAVSQDGNGDLVVTPSVSWQKWANISQDSGTLLIGMGLTNFNESYKVQMWYEPSRPTKANYIITYEGKSLKVYNVKLDNEGKRTIETITAYTGN